MGNYLDDRIIVEVICGARMLNIPVRYPLLNIVWLLECWWGQNKQFALIEALGKCDGLSSQYSNISNVTKWWVYQTRQLSRSSHRWERREWIRTIWHDFRCQVEPCSHRVVRNLGGRHSGRQGSHRERRKDIFHYTVGCYNELCSPAGTSCTHVYHSRANLPLVLECSPVSSFTNVGIRSFPYWESNIFALWDRANSFSSFYEIRQSHQSSPRGSVNELWESL